MNKEEYLQKMFGVNVQPFFSEEDKKYIDNRTYGCLRNHLVWKALKDNVEKLHEMNKIPTFQEWARVYVENGYGLGGKIDGMAKVSYDRWKAYIEKFL